MSERALALIDLFRDLQEASTRTDLMHRALTRTRRVIPFDFAVRWVFDPRHPVQKLRFHETSDSAHLPSEDTPFINSLREILLPALTDGAPPLGEATPLRINDAVDHPHAMIARINRSHGTDAIEGVLFLRQHAFDSGDCAVIGELALLIHTISRGLDHSSSSTAATSVRSVAQAFLTKKRLALIAILLLLCPFPMTISAPAELVADGGQRVTAPFDGIIHTIHVDPGDVVKNGDVLIEFDDQLTRAKRDLAAQELAAARNMLPRLLREALLSPEKKGEIARVRATIAMKEVDMAYHDRQLANTRIHAHSDGIAIFGDRSDSQGQRVQAGESLMTLAPQHSRNVLIRVPAARLVPVDLMRTARVYWDPAPFFAAPLTLTHIGYQATPDPDGMLTYKFRATLKHDDPRARVGWRGTAHIDTGWSTLGYTIIRRPLSWIRMAIGW